MRRALVIVLSAGMLAALAAACGNIQPPPFPPFTQPPAPLDFDRLLSDPGVYSGRHVALTGLLTVRDGQACLQDRNRSVAVRLTGEQAALYAGVAAWPVRVDGVFTQNLCPRDFVCPEFCTPFGLEAGALISEPVL